MTHTERRSADLNLHCTRPTSENDHPAECILQKHEVPAWQHVSSRQLLDHPYVKLIEETVIPPSGQPTVWWRFAGGRDVVCLMCLDDRQRVLVTYQYNPPPRQVVEEFPGGSTEAGESLEEAARRELLEETGLYARSLEPIGAFFLNHRRSHIKCRVFLATDLEQRSASPEATEIIGHEWVAVQEFDDRIRRGEIENMVSLACWSLFRAIRPDGENA